MRVFQSLFGFLKHTSIEKPREELGELSAADKQLVARESANKEISSQKNLIEIFFTEINKVQRERERTSSPIEKAKKTEVVAEGVRDLSSAVDELVEMLREQEIPDGCTSGLRDRIQKLAKEERELARMGSESSAKARDGPSLIELADESLL